MADTYGSKVIFQGSKFFWRTRNNIDVAIVSHIDLGIVEIIAYEPSLNVEAERIYLDSYILDSKLNQAEIEAKFCFAKQNNIPHTAQFEAEVEARAIADYILSRLFIKEYSKEGNIFAVRLQIENVDLDIASDNFFVRERPIELLPHIIKHHRLYSGEKIAEAQLALVEAQYNLEEQCTKAMEMQAATSVQLSHKQRWRIPIVLVKLSRKKSLDSADSKIWSAVSHNLKTQEDIDNLTKVALRMDVPPNTPTHRSSHSPRRVPSVNATPNRSPTLTPRSRANSQRLFNNTVSSQNRALTIAEADASTHPTPRKQLMRANSKSTVPKSPRKTPRRSVSKITIRAAPTPTRGDSIVESKNTHSLIEKITCGISTFAATVSAKLGGLGSAKITPGNAGDCGNFVTVNNCVPNGASLQLTEQCNQLSATAYQNDLLERDSSVCTPVTGGATADTARHAPLSRQVSNRYHYTELEEAATHANGLRVKPTKRRSYFGSILTSFTSATKDDGSLCTESQPSASNLEVSKKYASGSAPAGEGLSFSAALAAWFSWTHSATVVPVDLSLEYMPVEQRANVC